MNPTPLISGFGTCEQGKYGDECQYSCHCPVGTECDPLTGKCPDVCAPGWSGAPYCQAGKTSQIYGSVKILLIYVSSVSEIVFYCLSSNASAFFFFLWFSIHFSAKFTKGLAEMDCLLCQSFSFQTLKNRKILLIILVQRITVC